jgi:hypothetical protein
MIAVQPETATIASAASASFAPRLGHRLAAPTTATSSAGTASTQ